MGARFCCCAASWNGSLTQPRPFGRRGHPAKKQTLGARSCFFPRLPTIGGALFFGCAAPRAAHSLTRPGRFEGSDPAINNTRDAFMFLLRVCCKCGCVSFFCCVASWNGSLTHAAGAGGTPRPPSQKNTPGTGLLFLLRVCCKCGCVCFFAARPLGTALSLTQPEPLGRRGHPAKKTTGGVFVLFATRSRGAAHSLTCRTNKHTSTPFVCWSGAATEQKKHRLPTHTTTSTKSRCLSFNLKLCCSKTRTKRGRTCLGLALGGLAKTLYMRKCIKSCRVVPWRSCPSGPLPI